jgi:endonuclease/exonuclease/phosphatase (EEP) superfamily protein YafD
VLFAVGFFVLYWARPVALEGITIWPSWIWIFPGLVVAWARPRRLWVALRWPLLAWSLVALVFSEVWRVVIPVSDERHELRVVTMNTGGGLTEAMREVAELAPDVVLLQESYSVRDPQALITEVFGEGYTGVIGRDATIIVRGEVLSSDLGWTNHTFARVRLADGREMDVVSLRMQAPRARTDYWTLDCWRSYSSHRTEHIKELSEIWERVKRLRTGAPMVLGGDFNLVPDSRETDLLGEDLVDSYRAAGRGWYATALAGAQLFRIDKVWGSSELVPRGTSARDSFVSDHKFVVAEFEWREGKR